LRTDNAPLLLRWENSYQREDRMDEKREAIERLRRTHGYDEQEAEAAYHLGQARSLIREMYSDDAEARAAIEGAFGAAGFARIYAQMFLMSSVLPHFDALESLLTKKVLARHFPEGWDTGR
jgi:hypothetical protein